MAFSSGAFSELPFSTVGGAYYSSTLSESASGADLVSAGATFAVSISESAIGADFVFPRGLWTVIDDTQNPNWIQITVTQNDNWQSVTTNAGTGWTIIPTV
jgi:hypothetical protein